MVNVKSSSQNQKRYVRASSFINFKNDLYTTEVRTNIGLIHLRELIEKFLNKECVKLISDYALTYGVEGKR